MAVIGSTSETYWQKLLALGYPETGIDEGLIYLVIPNEGASAATDVAEFLAWYIQDGPTT